MEWVEIIEPKTKDVMFANLQTGEVVWEEPEVSFDIELCNSETNTNSQ